MATYDEKGLVLLQRQIEVYKLLKIQNQILADKTRFLSLCILEQHQRYDNDIAQDLMEINDAYVKPLPTV